MRTTLDIDGDIIRSIRTLADRQGRVPLYCRLGGCDVVRRRCDG